MVSALEQMQNKHSEAWDKAFQFHLTQRGTTYAEYSKKKRVELGLSILPKVRIYLDTKYWIYCRDALYGNPQKSSHGKIYSLLSDLTERDEVLCPGNWTILEELFKQKDSISRKKTALVIEAFSHNVMLEAYPLLVRIEMLHMLSKLYKGDEHVYPLTQLVWGHCGHILGECVPGNTAFDGETQNALQKTFYDIMSSISFSEFADILSEANFDIASYLCVDSAEYLKTRNHDNESHKKDFNSFKQVFEIELAGMVDEMRPDIEDAFAYLYFKETGKRPTKQEKAEGIADKLPTNFFFHAFRMNKLATEFPQLHIVSNIHAALRYKQIPFKKGDFHDHFHSCSALPYCDYFFTERKLANLLTSSPLCLDEQYNCKVLFDEEQIIGELQSVHSHSGPDANERDIT